MVSRNSTTPNGLAILNYYPNHPKRSSPTIPPNSPLWNDVEARVNQSVKIKARQGYILPPPQISDRVIVMLNTHNTINGHRRWSINNASFNFPHTPYLIAPKRYLKHALNQNSPSDGYDFAIIHTEQTTIYIYIYIYISVFIFFIAWRV